jgi:hypothetical protein
MARPTKLNDSVREKLCQAVAAGCTLKDAAALAEISTSSLARYREQDPTLAAALRVAQGQAAVACVLILRKAAQEGDWRAAAWWLERRHPEEWGRRTQRVLTDQGAGRIRIEEQEEQQQVVRVMTLDELRTIREIYKAADARRLRNGAGKP